MIKHDFSRPTTSFNPQSTREEPADRAKKKSPLIRAFTQ